MHRVRGHILEKSTIVRLSSLSLDLKDWKMFLTRSKSSAKTRIITNAADVRAGAVVVAVEGPENPVAFPVDADLALAVGPRSFLHEMLGMAIPSSFLTLVPDTILRMKSKVLYGRIRGVLHRQIPHIGCDGVLC